MKNGLGQRWAAMGQRGKDLAARPLGVALLAALLLHGLGLTYAGLRNNRTAQAPLAPGAPDDTPELLRFSRRAPQALPLSTIPLPPPSLLPPPPPNLLAPLPEGQAPGARTPKARGSLSRGPQSRGAQAAVTKPRRAATRMQVARGPKANPTAPSLGAPTAALPAELGAAREALEALRTGPAAEDRDGASMRTLWDQATAVETEALPDGMDLRRMPATKAKDLGLAEGEKRGVRMEGLLLVAWLEGDQLWLLQGPAVRAEAGGAG